MKERLNAGILSVCVRGMKCTLCKTAGAVHFVGDQVLSFAVDGLILR